MEDIEQDNSRRIDGIEGRMQTIENRLVDLAKYLDGVATRGNLHPPTPADPTHDNKEEQIAFRCSRDAVFAKGDNGEAQQVGGCGAVVNRVVRVNQETVPDEIVCPVCGAIAKRVEDK